MGILVSGIGARCGTSDMVRKVMDLGYELKGHQFPSHAHKVMNPGGFWEPEISELIAGIDISGKKVTKAFPYCLNQIKGVDLVLCMYRPNREEQIKSCLRSEAVEGTDFGLGGIEKMIDDHRVIMSEAAKRMKVVFLPTGFDLRGGLCL